MLAPDTRRAAAAVLAMTWAGSLPGCSDSRRETRQPDTSTQHGALPADSLVLETANGTQVWFTLARAATGADGRPCIERGLEIRQGGRRTRVPLLYTGASPVLLNDSTIRATLWTHCQPGEPYLVNLRSGQPVRDRGHRAS